MGIPRQNENGNMPQLPKKNPCKMKNDNAIYYPKWMEIVSSYEKETTKTAIARRSRITYSHVYNIIKQLEKRQIITTKKEGRECKVKLTEKGLSIKETVQILKNLTRRDAEQ